MKLKVLRGGGGERAETSSQHEAERSHHSRKTFQRPKDSALALATGVPAAGDGLEPPASCSFCPPRRRPSVTEPTSPQKAPETTR